MIERIERLAISAKSRRDACLREIDRRRAALGDALRRNLPEVEDAEFSVEPTSGKGREAA